jgi:lipoprotein-anchoring transpeptidase ErfK/SrfK
MVPGRLGLFAAAAVAAAIATGLAAPSAGARNQGAVKPTQETAALLRSHKVLSAPRAGASRVGTVSASGPLTGVRTVLPVIRRGGQWLKVMLPGRPNGHKGWIAQQGTALRQTTWHVVVRTSSRQVLAYREGHLVRVLAAIVGTSSTPTPQGQFFVEESVRMFPGSPGWPFALALSARSNVLQEFEGGPGQIGIHGVANIGGTLGTAVSHGCVRVADESSAWLAARIAPGVPVTITE